MIYYTLLFISTVSSYSCSNTLIDIHISIYIRQPGHRALAAPYFPHGGALPSGTLVKSIIFLASDFVVKKCEIHAFVALSGSENPAKIVPEQLRCLLCVVFQARRILFDPPMNISDFAWSRLLFKTAIRTAINMCAGAYTVPSQTYSVEALLAAFRCILYPIGRPVLSKKLISLAPGAP